jgi:PAS domain S-box-containing protein
MNTLSKNKIETSEAKFSNLIAQVPMPIATFQGPRFIVDTINEKALEIWGKTYGEVINKPLFESSPELEDRLIKIFNDIYTTGEPFIANEMQVQLKRSGKADTAYFNSVYQPLRDLDNKIYGIILIGTEVTESVIARKQIEASEQRFSNLLSQSLMAIAIFKGPEMVVTFANEPMLNVLGKGNAVLNKPLTVGVPELKDQIFPKLLADVYNTGVPFEAFETKAILVRKGIPVDAYFNFVYQPYREIDDTITGITVLATEVTEQVLAKKQIEQSEKQFRTFADSIQNLAWIANGEGSIYWYNQRWYDYTGSTFEEMQGWGWGKVHHPDHVKKVVEFVKEAWKKNEAFELTFPLRRYDGEYRWFLTRAYPVKDANGNIDRWIGTNTDIHEQKIKEEQKDEFISIASHELKTPLTIAKTYIQLLSQTFEESGKEQEREMIYATKANDSIDRLNRLISELLDVSKIQSGNLPLHITSFNFDEIFTDTIENLQRTLPKHSIIHSGETKKQVSGDKERLQQVIINLINNAAKYSPDANKIFVHISDCEKGEIKVEIKDSGIGIAKNDLEKIFERYYRVENMTGQFQGLGIGLFISSEIIRRHNGKLGAESKPGIGSTFYFTLPC